MSEVKTKEATEVKKEELSPEQMIKEAGEKREGIRMQCGKEIDESLKKYNCELTAQMLISERGAIPQVFIADARNT